MKQTNLMILNSERCEAEENAVISAIGKLLDRPAKVDFYSVAAESGVSRSTLYRNLRLRTIVERVRDSQPDPWEMLRAEKTKNADLTLRLASLDRLKKERSVIDYALVSFLDAA